MHVEERALNQSEKRWVVWHRRKTIIGVRDQIIQRCRALKSVQGEQLIAHLKYYNV
jgi:hypothetical protein